MAKRLNMSDVLQLLEDDNFGLFEEVDSDFEGEGVESYLPRADPELSHVENSELVEEDEEPLDYEDIVFDDSSSSSDVSVTQPFSKYYCSKRYRIKKYLFLCPQFLDLHKVQQPHLPQSSNTQQ